MFSQQAAHDIQGPEETAALAAGLAPRLGAGDVILLSGGIGAGKTHFARALIQARQNLPEDVPSPTFTLVQTYTASDCEIWHSDLYRLDGPEQVPELGLIEAFDTALCLVEWPDRLGAYVPQTAMAVSLETPDPEGRPDHRRLLFSWSDPRWSEILAGLLDAETLT